MTCRPSLTCSTPQTTTSSTASKPTPTTFYSPTFHTRLTYPTSCATDHTTWHLSIRQNFLITQTILSELSISTHTNLWLYHTIVTFPVLSSVYLVVLNEYVVMLLWRRFNIIKKGVGVYWMESTEGMKCWGRKRSGLNWKFDENGEVIWLREVTGKERCSERSVWIGYDQVQSVISVTSITCWVRLKEEKSVRNWEVKLSEALSRWILKSPVVRNSWEVVAAKERKELNSSRKNRERPGKLGRWRRTVDVENRKFWGGKLEGKKRWFKGREGWNRK